MKRIADGEQPAFRELMEAWANPLAAYIYRLVKDDQLTEEIVQDIFLQIWQSRETLSAIRNFRSYLFVISRNYAIDAIRKMVTENRNQRRYAASAHQFLQDHPVTEAELTLVEQAIGQLPPQQKRVWELCRRDGKTYAEAASELRLSKETVKYYLKLASTSIMEFVVKRVDYILAGAFISQYLKNN